MRFKSVERPNTVYVVDKSESSWNLRHKNISDYVQEYDTCGDGMIQHSNSYHSNIKVIQDFLISLIYHIKDNPTDFNMEFWPKYPHPDKKTIIFLYNIRYKEGKTQYYSVTDLKISSASSKMYDKRWEKIESWADGSINAFVRLLNMNYKNILEKIFMCEYISNVLDDIEYYHHNSDELLAIYLGDAKDKEKARNILYLYRTVNEIYY